MPTQRLNPHDQHWQEDFLPLSHLGSPILTLLLCIFAFVYTLVTRPQIMKHSVSITPEDSSCPFADTALVKPPYYPHVRVRTNTHTTAMLTSISSGQFCRFPQFCNTVPHTVGTLQQLPCNCLRFINVAAWGSRWYALTAVKYLIYNSTTFIHSVADGNLGCFHFGLF